MAPMAAIKALAREPTVTQWCRFKRHHCYSIATLLKKNHTLLLVAAHDSSPQSVLVSQHSLQPTDQQEQKLGT